VGWADGEIYSASIVLPADDASTRSALPSAVDVRGNKSGRSGDYEGGKSIEGGGCGEHKLDETVRRAGQAFVMRPSPEPSGNKSHAREPRCVCGWSPKTWSVPCTM
jgi:hypothetical protein